MKYKNYGVVVTGGGHGIGKAIIEEFVREGAKVCFIDINADYGKSLVSESVFFFHGDVSLEDDLNQFICFCKEKYETQLLSYIFFYKSLYFCEKEHCGASNTS